jgi:hypothetical protein
MPAALVLTSRSRLRHAPQHLAILWNPARMQSFRGNTESGGVVAIVPPAGRKNGQKTYEN